MTRRVENAVILTGSDCALIYSAARLHELRAASRGRSDRLFALLTDIAAVAVTHATSDDGTKPLASVENGESGSGEEVVTVIAIARRAGITPRAVRNHIEAGVLHATKAGKTWIITSRAAEQYLAGRKAA